MQLLSLILISMISTLQATKTIEETQDGSVPNSPPVTGENSQAPESGTLPRIPPPVSIPVSEKVETPENVQTPVKTQEQVPSGESESATVESHTKKSLKQKLSAYQAELKFTKSGIKLLVTKLNEVTSKQYYLNQLTEKNAITSDIAVHEWILAHLKGKVLPKVREALDSIKSVEKAQQKLEKLKQDKVGQAEIQSAENDLKKEEMEKEKAIRGMTDEENELNRFRIAPKPDHPMYAPSKWSPKQIYRNPGGLVKLLVKGAIAGALTYGLFEGGKWGWNLLSNPPREEESREPPQEWTVFHPDGSPYTIPHQIPFQPQTPQPDEPSWWSNESNFFLIVIGSLVCVILLIIVCLAGYVYWPSRRPLTVTKLPSDTSSSSTTNASSTLTATPQVNMHKKNKRKN